MFYDNQREEYKTFMDTDATSYTTYSELGIHKNLQLNNNRTLL